MRIHESILKYTFEGEKKDFLYCTAPISIWGRNGISKSPFGNYRGNNSGNNNQC